MNKLKFCIRKADALILAESNVAYYKKQVQEMVQRLLSLPGIPGSDAADALGIAICHAHGFDAIRALEKAAVLSNQNTFRIRRGRLIR